jgi:hypothetical protein
VDGIALGTRTRRVGVRQEPECCGLATAGAEIGRPAYIVACRRRSADGIVTFSSRFGSSRPQAVAALMGPSAIQGLAAGAHPFAQAAGIGSFAFPDPPMTLPVSRLVFGVFPSRRAARSDQNRVARPSSFAFPSELPLRSWGRAPPLMGFVHFRLSADIGSRVHSQGLLSLALSVGKDATFPIPFRLRGFSPP